MTYFSEPKLEPLEKLYVNAYLSTLSHSSAYRVVEPELKNHPSSNKYSSRENIKYHISKALQNKTESLSLTADKILERLYLEATTSTNSTARIQALTLLGKQMGLFSEGRPTDSYTINVINYSNSDKENTPLNLLEEIEEDSIDSTLSENILITTY